jgi:NADH dehydrogenase
MMNIYLRRLLVGIAAGALSGVLLGLPFDNIAVGVLVGGVLGAAYARALPANMRVAYQHASLLDGVMTAAALGVVAWTLVSVLALPLAARGVPAWTAGGMRALFPALVGWMLFGACLGGLARGLDALASHALASHALGPESTSAAPGRVITSRIVIVGGGFAGVSAARRLEQLFGTDPTVALTLVSDTNALLFTPMLAEVAGGSLEAMHISPPLRTSLRRTDIVQGRVAGIDIDRRKVLLTPDGLTPDPVTIPFDHVVLALGAVSNYLGLADVEASSLDFKALTHAIAIRNRVVEMFERADREPDPETRRALVTFVVAGGGFAGVELAGALNDFARGILAVYPHIPPDEVQVILIHSRERVLPELSASLAAYALRRMSERGVTFLLNTRVVGARPGAVRVRPDEEIRTETLVWAAGTRPNTLVETLPVARDKREAVVVDETLAVAGHPGIWALGDCASIPDLVTGGTCPPTAQYALRQAKTVAHNIYASVRGRPARSFRFKALGAVCVIGHQTACAEIRGLRFSGLFAWLMWRAIYFEKLPSLERKVRVLADWILELFFPRDIVQTSGSVEPSGGVQRAPLMLDMLARDGSRTSTHLRASGATQEGR